MIENDYDMTRLLVELGADVNINHGAALADASEHGYNQIMKYLLGHGAKHIWDALQNRYFNKT